MQLNTELLSQIPFSAPTPIQRLSIPSILNGENVLAIARTGSGKTLAYLLPALQKVLNNQKVLIIVPTRELCHQVKRMIRRLSKTRVDILHGGTEELEIKNNLVIGTVGRLNYSLLPHFDLLVVDEVDKVFGDKNMKTDFFEIAEKISASQSIYFSATLPEELISLVTDFKVIKVDNGISPTLENHFFYAFDKKINALLKILKKIVGKTIIFTTHKYSVEMLSDALQNYKHVFIHSGLDPEMRQKSMDCFLKTHEILVVTDLASRGLDIPLLQNVINFDLCDYKTYLHRVGRVARCGRIGQSFSLVSYEDYFYFCAIRKEIPDIQLGLIPLNEKLPEMDTGRIIRAENAYKKATSFVKLSVEVDKEELKHLKMHPMFADEQNNKIDFMKNYKKKVKVEEKIENKRDYKDQFFIPYENKKGIYSLVENVPKDSHFVRKEEKNWNHNGKKFYKNKK